jgi:hypothetical protein
MMAGSVRILKNMGFLVLGLAFLTSRAAFADDKVVLLGDSYVESFIPNAKISGSLLVGVKWADETGNFDPSKINLRVPAVAKGRKACVEINSQDGRYSAKNLYQIKADTAPVASFETKTAFASNLSQYNAQTMAVAVRLVDSCDSADVGTLLPVSLNAPAAAAAGRKLAVLVNAEPHKVALRLTDAKGEIGHFTGCTSVGSNVNVAFTSSCELVLDRVTPGASDLEVRVNERFDRSVKHFPIMLD